MTNSRVFYACLGVLVSERNDRTGDEPAEEGTYLNGVQSVGVNSDFVSRSLMDVGRFQKRYHYYGKQAFEITIERVIDQTSDFFYHVNPTNYVGGKTGYEKTHMLYPDNIGPCGETNSAGGFSKSLKNYDISVMYGADNANMLKDNTSDIKVVTYRNCLITNISYNISADAGAAVKENITLISRVADFEEIAENEIDDLPSAQEDGNVIKRADVDLLPPKGASPKTAGTNSILPTEVTEMFNLGDANTNTLDGEKILGVNNIEISATINYTEVPDVGEWRTTDDDQSNLYRYVVLPIEVTCAFTGTLRSPYQRDLIYTDTTFSMADGATGSTDWNRVNKSIRIVAEKFPSAPTSTYFIWDIGQHNYLTDISYTGGDTGGGNTEVTMTYQNDYSDLVLVKDTNIRDLSTLRDFTY